MSTPHDPNHPPEYDPHAQRQPGYGQEDPYYGDQPPQYGGQQPDHGYGHEQPPPYGGQGGYPGYGGYAGGYAPPPYQLPKGMAIAALVLGILALITFWTAVGGILLGLAAVILGIIGARRASKGTAGGRGMAVTGLVLGVLALIGGIIAAIIYAFVVNRFGDTIRECQGLPQDQMRQCIRQNLPGQQGLGFLGTDRVVVWK